MFWVSYGASNSCIELLQLAVVAAAAAPPPPALLTSLSPYVIARISLFHLTHTHARTPHTYQQQFPSVHVELFTIGVCTLTFTLGMI